MTAVTEFTVKTFSLDSIQRVPGRQLQQCIQDSYCPAMTFSSNLTFTYSSTSP